jgi:hypothetical protein
MSGITVAPSAVPQPTFAPYVVPPELTAAPPLTPPPIFDLYVAPPVITFAPLLTPEPTAALLPTAANAVLLSTGPDPWASGTGLVAVDDPTALPNLTVPGDETSALMLPAAPEISHLPKAFAHAVQRLAERPPAIITFVDPVTGYTGDDTSPAVDPGTQDQSWLLVDPDSGDDTPGYIPGAVSSQISWDSHPI